MTDLPVARRVARSGSWQRAADRVALDYAARRLRRARLRTEGGLAFRAELPEIARLEEGDAFALEDGRLVEVLAAPEALFSVTGDLRLVAWHLGRHRVPCEIGAKRLTIRREARLKPILEGLGARVVEAEGQFRPLGSTEAAQVRHHGAHHHLAGEDGPGPGEEA